MRRAKDTLLSATSPRLTQRAKEVYKIKDKEVKRIAEERAFVENATYTKQVKDNEGKVITT